MARQKGPREGLFVILWCVLLVGTAASLAWGGNVYRAPDGAVLAVCEDGTEKGLLRSLLPAKGGTEGWIQRPGTKDEGWTALQGPYGGLVSSLSVDPTNPEVIYAGVMRSGVFKSTNGGQSWVDASNGFLSPNAYNTMNVFSLANHPQNPEILFAGVGNNITYSSWVGDGLYKSTNGGDSWALIGAQDTCIRSVAVDPNDGNTVYAGRYYGQGGGIFKSTDEGATWTLKGLDGITVEAIVVCPSSPQVLYVGASHGGSGSIWKTTDGGESWSSLTASLGPPKAVAVSPVNPEVAFAVTYNAVSTDGTYRTTNGGSNWTKVGTMAFAVATSPLDSNLVYASGGGFTSSIYRSTNRGTSWTQTAATYGCNSAYNSRLGLVIAPTTPETVYGGILFGGVWKGVSGSNWEKVNAGLVGSSVKALAIAPSNENTFYAACFNDGIWKSTDGGTGWTQIVTSLPKPNNMGPDYNFLSLAVDPSDPNRVLAGGNNSAVYLSTDGGLAWTMTSFANYSQTYAIEINPANTQIVHLAAPNSSSSMGIWKSTDGGPNWSKVVNGYGTALGINPLLTKGDTVYGATSDMDLMHDTKLRRTTDGGLTWDSLYVYPNRFDVIYDLAVDPYRPNTLYSANYMTSVNRSTDGGQTFVQNVGGLDWEASSLVARADTVIVATPNGPYFSTDGGQSWNLLLTGLKGVQTSIIEQTPKTLSQTYCGTNGNGIYRLLGLPYGVEAQGPAFKPRLMARLKANPNPFFSFTSIPGHKGERFSIYDIAGRRIRGSSGERLGEGLSAGVYFVRSESGEGKPLRILKLR